MSIRTPGDPHTHSRLITEAAKKLLRPLGLAQKGRSRTWLADEGWFVIVVEFQPSGFSRGSYLNVGCNWLWGVKRYLSFDEGNRVAGFTRFKDEEQFRAVAETLAQRAASEVARYRALFPSVRKLSEFYLEKTPVPGWPSFNAAVAHGLSGKIHASQRSFDCWGPPRAGEPDWTRDARVDSERLSAFVDTGNFAGEIKARITQARALLKLPAITEIRF